MTKEIEAVDSPADGKASRRDRFRGALQRTKSKFKKDDNKTAELEEPKVNDDVEDFLAGGRTSTSTRPSVSDTFTERSPSPRRPSTASSLPSQLSPRKIVVPRIDISQAQRWPAAQSIQTPHSAVSSDFLRPEYQGRSHSMSSFSKHKGRARGLSVMFNEAPPIVIGEGGDEAETPTVEISRAKIRARSVSPVAIRPASSEAETASSGSFMRRKPLAMQVDAANMKSLQQGQPPSVGVFTQRRLQRTQTGLDETKSAVDREFEMSLQSPITATPSTPGAACTSNYVAIHHPKPIHPPVPIPQIKIPDPELARRQSRTYTHDFHMQLEEGRALRHKHSRDLSESSNSEEHAIPSGLGSQGCAGPSTANSQDQPLLPRTIPPQEHSTYPAREPRLPEIKISPEDESLSRLAETFASSLPSARPHDRPPGNWL